MKECWSEGNLRAYLDRELAPEEMEQATAHLAECPACSARYDVLSARAQRVSVWMDSLPQPVEAAAIRRPPRKTAKWVAAGLAAAAALVMAAVVAPHRTAEPTPLAHVTAPPVVHQAEPETEPAPAVHEAVVRPQPQRRSPVRHSAERTETFVALDNEPFEAGWVVRMALGPDQIQADVVFSADGRARAYRLVGDSSN